jgi:L-iditol 2-dehydrogenase
VRAVVLRGVGDLQVLYVDDPTCGDDDVVIAVANCGVCGTDRAIFRGEYEVATPIVLGHEFAGTVVEVGDSVSRFVEGDRVVVDPNVVDDVCFFCERGHSHLCSGLSPLGVGRSGGFAERAVVPARYLYTVPEGVSLLDAALVEPLACCVRGIDQADVSVGDVVVVSGAGPIGCFLIQLARLSGAATVISIEPEESRHPFARRAGADVVCHPSDAASELGLRRGPVGADVVIEASGSLVAARTSFEMVRRGGTILLFGVYPQGETVPVSPFRINEDELRLVGSLNNPSTHARALELISSGRICLEGVISHRLGLEDLEAAMHLENFDRPGKIVIDLNPE